MRLWAKPLFHRAIGHGKSQIGADSGSGIPVRLTPGEVDQLAALPYLHLMLNHFSQVIFFISKLLENPTSTIRITTAAAQEYLHPLAHPSIRATEEREPATIGFHFDDERNCDRPRLWSRARPEQEWGPLEHQQHFAMRLREQQAITYEIRRRRRLRDRQKLNERRARQKAMNPEGYARKWREAQRAVVAREKREHPERYGEYKSSERRRETAKLYAAEKREEKRQRRRAEAAAKQGTTADRDHREGGDEERNKDGAAVRGRKSSKSASPATKHRALKAVGHETSTGRRTGQLVPPVDQEMQESTHRRTGSQSRTASVSTKDTNKR